MNESALETMTADLQTHRTEALLIIRHAPIVYMVLGGASDGGVRLAAPTGSVRLDHEVKGPFRVAQWQNARRVAEH